MKDASRWERVKQVFQAALERSPETRPAFLAETCGDDRSLRAEVESLLLAHEGAGSFAERPALEEWADVAMHGREAGDRQLQPGDQLGPYELGEQLGAGGMGEVFKARDTRLDRTVAIKLLPWYLRDDPDLKQRFEREAKTLATLSHPHICPVFDVGRHDPSTPSGQAIDFLVMDTWKATRLRIGWDDPGPSPPDQ